MLCKDGAVELQNKVLLKALRARRILGRGCEDEGGFMMTVGRRVDDSVCGRDQGQELQGTVKNRMSTADGELQALHNIKL